jgi:hypothetical protein
VAVSLTATCITAFVAVFVLLVVLALVIRLTTTIFPNRIVRSDDAAVIAAINAAVVALVPGARVTHLEETTR